MNKDGIIEEQNKETKYERRMRGKNRKSKREKSGGEKKRK